MATLNVYVPDELEAEINSLFVTTDKDALVTGLLIDFLDRIKRLPAAKQAIVDNPELPIGFVLDLLEARAEGHELAIPFLAHQNHKITTDTFRQAPDPILAELWEVKRQINAEAAYDVAKLAKDAHEAAEKIRQKMAGHEK